MHRRDFLTVLAACPLCAAASAVRAERFHEPGERAAGKRIALGSQGPGGVDLSGKVAEGLDLVSTDWPSREGLILRNHGDALQVLVPEGYRSFVQGREFELLEFSFRRGPVHKSGEILYPLELHFLHQAAEGDYMALGVLFEAGAPHPGLTPFLQAAPTALGEGKVEGGLALSDLLPADCGFYSYVGAPLGQSNAGAVTWVLYDRPLSLSQVQIEALSDLLPDKTRPAQLSKREAAFPDA